MGFEACMKKRRPYTSHLVWSYLESPDALFFWVSQRNRQNSRMWFVFWATGMDVLSIALNDLAYVGLILVLQEGTQAGTAQVSSLTKALPHLWKRGWSGRAWWGLRQAKLCYHPPPIEDQWANAQKRGSGPSSKLEISTGCGRSQCDWQHIQTCFLFARVCLVFSLVPMRAVVLCSLKLICGDFQGTVMFWTNGDFLKI